MPAASPGPWCRGQVSNDRHFFLRSRFFGDQRRLRPGKAAAFPPPSRSLDGRNTSYRPLELIEMQAFSGLSEPRCRMGRHHDSHVAQALLEKRSAALSASKNRRPERFEHDGPIQHTATSRSRCCQTLHATGAPLRDSPVSVGVCREVQLRPENECPVRAHLARG